MLQAIEHLEPVQLSEWVDKGLLCLHRILLRISDHLLLLSDELLDQGNLGLNRLTVASRANLSVLQLPADLLLVPELIFQLRDLRIAIELVRVRLLGLFHLLHTVEETAHWLLLHESFGGLLVDDGRRHSKSHGIWQLRALLGTEASRFFNLLGLVRPQVNFRQDDFLRA